MKHAMHLMFCRLAAPVAAGWGSTLLLWPGMSSWLPAGEMPLLHARCIGVLHLALACGLWSARRRLDAAAARLPLLLVSTWGAAAFAAALVAPQSDAGKAWLAGMGLAAAGAMWLLVHAEALTAPAERPDVAWAALAFCAGAIGTALLLLPAMVAAHWPWRMDAAHAAAYGAPLLGIGAMAAAAARERRRYAREPAMHACLALSAGLLAASLLHRELFGATRIVTWLWFGLLVAVAAWAAAHQGWIQRAMRNGLLPWR